MAAYVTSRLASTFQDRSYLRGTSTATLLEGFGQRLRATSGGTGFVDVANEEYDKSFQVPSIDVFLSHSWHAPWFPKYLVLLIHFNGVYAVVACVVASLASFIFSYSAMTFETRTLQLGCWGDHELTSLPFFVGLAAFLVTLTAWHHIVRGTSLDPIVFLDKVCIHQADMTRKTAGIASIGAFLVHSKSVLVAWDGTYFSRLWCTFELSAFFTHRGTQVDPKKMTVLPIQLGLAVAVKFVLDVCVWPLVPSMIEDVGRAHGLIAMNIASACLVHGLPAFAAMRPLRRYCLDVSRLDQQLKEFDMRKAACFCCTNNHRTADKRVRLPCDREVVYKSIAHWYGGDDEQVGILRFNAAVSNWFREDMKRTLGNRAHIPYKFAIIWGIPFFLLSQRYIYHCELWVQCLRCLSFLLFRGPLSAFIIMNIVGLCAEKKRRCLNTLTDVILTLCYVVTFGLYQALRDRGFVRGDTSNLIAYYALEGALVFGIWCRPWSKPVVRRTEALTEYDYDLPQGDILLRGQGSGGVSDSSAVDGGVEARLQYQRTCDVGDEVPGAQPRIRY